MTDDILIDSPIISSDKLDSLININAKCAYNSLVQLQAVDHSKLSGVYIKIFEGEIDEFDSNILSYIIENKIKINGIIVEFSNYKSKKDNVVSKFIESYPELNKITNNFIASGKISISEYELLDSNFTEIIISKLPLIDNEITENNEEELKESIKIISSVLSIPDNDRMVLDTGQKAINIDYGFPKIKGIKSAEVQYLSAEHTNIFVEKSELKEFNLQDKIEIIPYDISSVLNQFDSISIIRNEKLLSIFEVSARGVYK